MTDISLYHIRNSWASESFDRLGAKIRTWRRRAESRKALTRMSARDLKDIGLTRAAASFEANKPFWRS